MPPQPQSSHPRWMFFTVIVVIAVLNFAQDVLMPVALALLLSFLLAPVVSWMQGLGLGRAVSVVLTTLVAFAIAVGLLVVAANQFVGLVEDLPSYRENLLQKIRSLSSIFLTICLS